MELTKQKNDKERKSKRVRDAIASSKALNSQLMVDKNLPAIEIPRGLTYERYASALVQHSD